jgi:hypothetical protein
MCYFITRFKVWDCMSVDVWVRRMAAIYRISSSSLSFFIFFFLCIAFHFTLSAYIPPGVKKKPFVPSHVSHPIPVRPHRCRHLSKKEIKSALVEKRGSQTVEDEPSLWNARFHMNSRQNYKYMVSSV